MAHHPITGALRRTLLTGEIDAAELAHCLTVQLGLHQEELRPLDQENLDEHADEQEAEAFERLEGLLSERLLSLVQEAVQQRDHFRPVAREELEELLALTPRARRQRISRARKRFRNPWLVDRLLDQSRQRLAFDPADAYELAELAAAAASRMPEADYGATLKGGCVIRAEAYRANALKAGGDLIAANEIMECALRDAEEVADPLARAEVFFYAASLRSHQRRLDEAGELLQKAAVFYELAGSVSELGKVLVQKASLEYHRGNHERAIEILRETLAQTHAVTEPHLYLSAMHNLALYLCESGDYFEAQRLVTANRDLYEECGDPHTHLRQQWLEGKVAIGLGEWKTAEAQFLGVREAVLDAGNGYDAAMVSLDLAMLYARQGRTGDMKRLAEEMLHIFHSQDIHREAIAAFLIFRRAALEEAVTIQMVQDLTAYLRQQQGTPPPHQELPS